MSFLLPTFRDVRLTLFLRRWYSFESLISSVLFSRSVVSDSLWPHGLQHARPPCPSPTPGACSNSCPLSRWCHQTISSSFVPVSSCLQFFPGSGSFLMKMRIPSSSVEMFPPLIFLYGTDVITYHKIITIFIYNFWMCF